MGQYQTRCVRGAHAVCAWCGYWGCSVDPFSQFRGNYAHFGGPRHSQSACVPCFLLLQCLLSCSLVCRPVGFKILFQNSVPLFEQSYVSLMASCRGVSPVCFFDFVCM